MLLHQDFIKRAKENSKKPAFIDRTTDRKITYDKALIGAFVIAGKFKKYEPGFIGIMIPTSAGAALSILGALIGGRVPVMINYSTGAEENIVYARQKLGFKTVITSKKLLEKIDCPKSDGMIFIEDILAGVSILDKAKALVKSKLPPRANFAKAGTSEDTAVVLFTSGSEKEPKAVPLSHKNIAANIRSLGKVFDLTAEDRFLANLPYFHVFGQTVNLWLPIHYGMTLVTYANPLDYKNICRIVREEAVTLMVGTPSFFRGYLQKSSPGDFASVRIALAGADKVPDALRIEWREKHKQTLYEAYGTTETSPAIAANSPGFNRPGSVGKVLPGVEVRIADMNSGQPVETGRLGKIHVRGDLVMAGYYDDIEETTFRLRDGWYDTGDMGYLDADGYLWHAGRLKRFVKIGGEMISLVRVENVLERILPVDVACCVVEIPDNIKGAVVVAVVNHSVDERNIVKRLKEHLPNIAIPKKFVVIEEFPYMGSGKVDFRKVTAMVLNSAKHQALNLKL